MGCSQSGGKEGTGREARIQDWERRDAYPEVLGCRNGGGGGGGEEEEEGANRKNKRKRRRRMRKKGKGEAASPPRGRGRRNRSPTNWRMHHPSCNDKHINVSWSPEAENLLNWMNLLVSRGEERRGALICKFREIRRILIIVSVT